MRPGPPDPGQAARYVRCVTSLTTTGQARAHPPGALPHTAGPHGSPSLHPWGPAPFPERSGPRSVGTPIVNYNPNLISN